MTDKRIIFLGTPAIASKCLKGMIEYGFNIVGVITKEDKIRGRNNEVEPSDVAKVAMEYNIPLHKPNKLNKDFKFVEDLKPDLLLTFAYGQMISDEVLSLSKYKPLNLHASLLPKYRGAAPIQYALRNGDKETGVSLMEMIHEMDAGDVYAVNKVEITSDDNYTSLADKLSDAGLKLVKEKLPEYFDNKLVGVKQDVNLVSLCPTIKKEEEILKLDSTPNDFINQVRSLSETPGGYLFNKKEILKIYKANYYSDRVEKDIGALIRPSKKELVLQLSSGQVKIEELQRPGKKKMRAIDFLNGVKNIDEIILKETIGNE